MKNNFYDLAKKQQKQKPKKMRFYDEDHLGPKHSRDNYKRKLKHKNSTDWVDWSYENWSKIK